MKTKEFEIVDPNDPFKSCLLDRRLFGDVLTNLLEGAPDGGVIALNNQWGTGKSTFLKMWKRHLEIHNYNPIVFNAWESDYEEDPLVPIISEIKMKIGQASGESFKGVLQVVGNLAIRGLGLGAKRLGDKVFGEEGTDALIDIITNEAEKYFKDELDVYEARQSSLIKFRELLGEYIANASNNKKIPLVFIIDELDRCRPDYAVKVLETIKHFFTISNLLFIVAVDKQQLCHSINGFYGSEKFDSTEYLRKFFDLEVELPEPNKDDFIIALIESHNINNHLYDNGNGSYLSSFADLLKPILSNFSLRKIEKYFSHLSLIFKSNLLYPESFSLFSYLLYLKYDNLIQYNKLKALQLRPNEIASLFEQSTINLAGNVPLRCHLEVMFALSYNEMLESMGGHQDKMYYTIYGGTTRFVYNSKVNDKFIQNYHEDSGRYHQYNSIIAMMDIIDFIK